MYTNPTALIRSAHNAPALVEPVRTRPIITHDEDGNEIRNRRPRAGRNTRRQELLAEQFGWRRR